MEDQTGRDAIQKNIFNNKTDGLYTVANKLKVQNHADTGSIGTDGNKITFEEFYGRNNIINSKNAK